MFFRLIRDLYAVKKNFADLGQYLPRQQKELDLRVRESNPGLPRTASSRNALMTGGYTDHYTNADLGNPACILRIESTDMFKI